MDLSKQPNNFFMEIPRDRQAVYSNVSRISHTPFDFVLDFSQALPGKPHSEILARIVLSPAGAKLFMQAMMDNVARYESQFGEINLPKGDTGLANNLFGRIKPPEGGENPDPTEKRE